MINFLNGNIISETGLRLPFSFQLHAAARRPRQRDDPVGRSRLPGDEEPDQHFSREPRRRGPPSLHHLLARQGNLNKYRNKSCHIGMVVVVAVVAVVVLVVAVLVVKWSVCSPSILTIRVQILLKPTVFL